MTEYEERAATMTRLLDDWKRSGSLRSHPAVNHGEAAAAQWARIVGEVNFEVLTASFQLFFSLAG